MSEQEKKSKLLKSRLEHYWGNLNEFKDPEVKKNVKGFMKGDILRKDFMTKNAGFFLLIVGLMFIYVGIRYYVENDLKEINNLQRELKDVRIEAITRSSELMEISKQSTVVRTINKKGLGLKESTEPPYLIK
ncbi:MAG: hypothetical protein K6G31_01840 [Paludibacteraceae bacterium]|nr:hypothetical protein [Paludibacteraceae bacterium]MCR5567995.1 hypothetical protein [Paludibacteraceae bacterium]